MEQGRWRSLAFLLPWLVLAGLLAGAGRARADDHHWDLIRPAGTLPPALRWAAQALDPGRNRLLFFGGVDSSGSQAGDLYVLDLNNDAFVSLRPRGTAPASRERAAMAFDVAGDRAVLFSGFNGGSIYLDETWFLELGDPVRGPEWKKMPFAASKPAPRLGASLVYVAPAAGGAGRLILFGGWDGVNRRAYQDVWALSLERGKEAWTRLSPAGTAPAARDGHVAVIDAARERMLVYGGWNRQRTDVTLDDLWALDLRPGQEGWTQLTPPNPRPPAQAWMSAVVDPCPDHRRLLMFGGWNGFADSAYTWSLGLEGDVLWTRLDPSGAKPRARDSHVAALDEKGRRMAIFGGWENQGELMRDTWVLLLSPCGAPSPTPEASAVRTPTASPTPRPGSPTSEATPTRDPRASATPDLLGTRVAETLTAIVPLPSGSPTPDLLRTAVAQTLTALVPSPSASPTPDLIGTIVAGTRTALAPTVTLTPNAVLTQLAATLTAFAATPVVAAKVHLPLLSR